MCSGHASGCSCIDDVPQRASGHHWQALSAAVLRAAAAPGRRPACSTALQSSLFDDCACHIARRAREREYLQSAVAVLGDCGGSCGVSLARSQPCWCLVPVPESLAFAPRCQSCTRSNRSCLAASHQKRHGDGAFRLLTSRPLGCVWHCSNALLLPVVKAAVCLQTPARMLPLGHHVSKH